MNPIWYFVSMAIGGIVGLIIGAVMMTAVSSMVNRRLAAERWAKTDRVRFSRHAKEKMDD